MNHIETKILNIDLLRTSDYHDIFLSQHLADKHLCDDKPHLFPERHEYYLDDKNDSDYGSRTLFSPKRKPDLTKYILWTDSVYLTDLSYFIHCPFTFAPHTDIHSVKTNPLQHWEFLLTSYI